MNERKIPWVEIGILVLAALLRFVLLDIKPPHFDEGVNGWFADQMAKFGYYHYDPTNYHGPLHFYAVFAAQTLFGREIWAIRLPIILVSIACVWMTLRFSRFLGAPATRWAALAMAISPAYVFYGRYTIHESWLVLFLLLTCWGILGLWRDGTRQYLFALVAGICGMILTKETYVMHVAAFGLAALTLWGWQYISPSRPAYPIARQSWTQRDLGASVGLAVLAIVFFYSGNFLDFPGLKGLYQTFAAWTHTGVDAAGHDKPLYDVSIFGHKVINAYWLMLFARYEWPALIGFVMAVILAFPSDARLRFIAIYGAGALVAYSLVPYKTPWCIISIQWPFLLLFGAAIAWLSKRHFLATVSMSAIVLGASLYQSLRLNFYHFTDAKEPYVYVQTYRQVETLTKPLLDLAKEDPRYYGVTGQILIDSYYPLPWMLGDFPQFGYYNKNNSPETHDADVVVVEASRADTVRSKLTEPYYRRDFRLRDSQDLCTVFFRGSVFSRWFGNQPLEVKEITPR
ncbi:TIGR03663 family protein [Terrimicrobium sacchariphilum]|uniref:TIGR03663 family protein n=1 Tax=Terrimicrobium sacchariphilum TaxID=690879 RepID=A0A146G5X1_TERSA|nr:flippase activity-associated protein Agl23 [Terrimicrobium sacchariphilum]GAT33169.1 TIGR03663 family protein [Terrimicrobium sacchariphilum]